MTLFINYNPTVGLSINTYRNSFYYSPDIRDLVDDILREDIGCCELEGALDALEDGDCWEGIDVTQGLLEELHCLITTHNINEVYKNHMEHINY